MSALDIIPIEAAELPAAVGRADPGRRARCSSPTRGIPSPGRIELRYVADARGARVSRSGVRVPIGAMPSAAGASPLLGWYEREMSDLFGITFEGHPEPHRLVLHEGAEPTVPPFDPAYPVGTPMPFVARESTIPEVVGPDVQQLPFGPVQSRRRRVGRARPSSMSASTSFTFTRSSSSSIAAWRSASRACRSPGDGACRAGLAASAASPTRSPSARRWSRRPTALVPERARLLRSLLAEMERIYNHLHYLGHLADTTTLKVGQAEGKLLEERAKQIERPAHRQPFPAWTAHTGRPQARPRSRTLARRGTRKAARRHGGLRRAARKHQQLSRPADHHRPAQPPACLRSGRDRSRSSAPPVSTATSAATTPTPATPILPSTFRCSPTATLMRVPASASPS